MFVIHGKLFDFDDHVTKWIHCTNHSNPLTPCNRLLMGVMIVDSRLVYTCLYVIISFDNGFQGTIITQSVLMTISRSLVSG